MDYFSEICWNFMSFQSQFYFGPWEGVESVGNIDIARATRPRATARLIRVVTLSIASIEERPALNPYWFGDRSGPSCFRWAQIRSAIIFSIIFPASLIKHISWKDDGDSQSSLSDFGININISSPVQG